ncbi:MAG: hypothetical protein V1492_06360 [Candidatus Micrarchaeota archaeon]
MTVRLKHACAGILLVGATSGLFGCTLNYAVRPRAAMSENIRRDVPQKKSELNFLKDAIETKQSFEQFKMAIKDEAYQQKLAEGLRNEGGRLLEIHKATNIPIPELESPLKEILDDGELRDRLRWVMESKLGKKLLRQVVSTTEGDFLALGYLLNTGGGQRLIMRMFLSKEGRESMATIIASACLATPDSFFIPVPEPYEKTERGDEFAEQMASDEGVEKLKKQLRTKTSRENLAELFKNNKKEVIGIIKQVLTSDEGVERMRAVMSSDGGQKFLQKIGKTDFGKELIVVFWLTEGGRMLTRRMLGTEEGTAAIFAMVTGLATGSSVINLLLPIKEEIRENPK